MFTMIILASTLAGFLVGLYSQSVWVSFQVLGAGLLLSCLVLLLSSPPPFPSLAHTHTLLTPPLLFTGMCSRMANFQEERNQVAACANRLCCS